MKPLLDKILNMLRVRQDKPVEPFDRQVAWAEHMLHMLNCTFSVLNEKPDEAQPSAPRERHYSFSYQSGNFILCVRDGESAASVFFGQVLSLSTQQFATAQPILSVVLRRSRFARLVFTAVDNGQRADIHLRGVVCLCSNADDNIRQFRMIADEIFYIAHFLHGEQEYMMERHEGLDSEIERNQEERHLYLSQDTEPEHKGAFDQRAEAKIHFPYRMGTLLEHCLNWPAAEWLNLVSMGKEQLHLSRFQIATFDFLKWLTTIDDNGLRVFRVNAPVTLMLDCIPYLGGLPRGLAITFSSFRTDERLLHFRVTLHGEAERLGMMIEPSQESARAEIRTIQLAAERQTDNLESEFQYVYGEVAANGKRRPRIDKDVVDLYDAPTATLLAYVPNIETARYLYAGCNAASQGRYYEAVVSLEAAYAQLAPLRYNASHELELTINATAFHLARCYQELGMYTQAFFHLIPNDSTWRSITHLNAFIELLHTSGDMRLDSFLLIALDYADDYICQFPADDEPQDWCHFYNQVRRLRLDTLIEARQLSDAMEMVKEMQLEDEDERDFALSRLHTILQLSQEWADTSEREGEGDDNGRLPEGFDFPIS